MKNRHTIGRQRFRIQVNSRKEAKAIFADLGEIVRNRLAIVQGEIFDDFAPEDQYLQIDQLRIDLGEIPSDYLENELVKRIDSALRKSLAEYLRRPENNGRIINEGDNKLAVFSIYLQRGILPWSQSNQQYLTLEALAQDLLEHAAEQLKSVLIELLPNQRVNKRLKLQLLPATLAKLHELVGKENWEKAATQKGKTGYSETELKALLLDAMIHYFRLGHFPYNFSPALFDQGGNPIIPKFANQSSGKQSQTIPSEQESFATSGELVTGPFPTVDSRFVGLNKNISSFFEKRLNEENKELLYFLSSLADNLQVLIRLTTILTPILLDKTLRQLYGAAWPGSNLLIDAWKKQQELLKIPVQTTRSLTVEQQLFLVAMQVLPTDSKSLSGQEIADKITAALTSTSGIPTVSPLRSEEIDRTALEELSSPAIAKEKIETATDHEPFIAYLTTGKATAELTGLGSAKIERQLRHWISSIGKFQERHLVEALKSNRFDSAIFQRLEWATALEFGKWAWGEHWQYAKNYLADLEQLFKVTNIIQLERDAVRHQIMGDWILQLLRSRTNILSPQGTVRVITEAFQITTASDWPALFEQLPQLKKSTAITWKSDLINQLYILPEEVKEDVFKAPQTYKDLELLRFFLQRGYLPATHAKHGLQRLEADLLNRANTPGDQLYSLLATLLTNERQFIRFREEFSIALHEKLFQTIVAGAEGHWSGFPDQLTLLYPDNQIWKLPKERYERYIYSGITKYLLLDMALAKATSPATIIKLWADLMAKAAGIEWSELVAYLEEILKRYTGTKNTSGELPKVFLSAIADVVIIGPKSQTELVKEATNHNSKVEVFGTTVPLNTEFKDQPNPENISEIERFVQLLLDGKMQPVVEAATSPEKMIAGLLETGSPHWELFLARFQGQKVNVERFYTYFSPLQLTQLVHHLVKERFPDRLQKVDQLRTLIIQSGIYQNERNAEEQFTRHKLRLLLVESPGFFEFTERILLFVSREIHLDLKETAGLLLDTSGTNTSTELISSLQRIRASLSERDKTNVHEVITAQSEASQAISIHERRTDYLHQSLFSQLKNGNPPWWNSEQPTIDEIAKLAIKNDLTTFIEFLNSKETISDKLFPFLSEETYTKIIKERYGEFSNFILTFIQYAQLLLSEKDKPDFTELRDSATLGKLQGSAITGEAITEQRLDPLKSKADLRTEKAKPSSQTNKAEKDGHNKFLAGRGSRKATWHYMLKKKTFTSEGFVRYVINQLSRQREMTPDQFRKKLLTAVSQQSTTGRPELFGLLRLLNEINLEIKEVRVIPETQEKSITLGNEINSEPDQTNEAISYADQLTKDFAAVNHFCYFGSPNPTHSAITKSELEQLQHRLLDLHPALCKPFYRAILQDKTARERIIQFFPLTLWQKIGDNIYPEQISWLERIWTDLEQLLATVFNPFRPKKMTIDAATHLLIHAGTHPGSLEQTIYLESLLNYLGEQRAVTLSSLFSRLKKSLEKSPVNLHHDWTKLLKKVRKLKIAQIEEQPKETTMSHELEEALYVHNAGLVILAPFLPRYFTMLEMTVEKQFIDEATAVRGAQLLHYLVTGQTSTPEHLMVLNKIMCGIDLLTPVPAELELSELEIETSTQLLNAILQNWDKMSGSTIDNLRGSFLLRDGMILEHSDSWALKVESKAYDIILSFLPWTISMISLPWMEKRLETEWNTSMN